MSQQLKRICIDDRRFFESAEKDKDLIVFNSSSQAAAILYTALQLSDIITKVQFSFYQQKGKAKGLHKRSMKSRFYADFLEISARHSTTKA